MEQRLPKRLPRSVWKAREAAEHGMSLTSLARGMTPLAPGDEPGSPADSLPPRPQTTGRRRAVDDDDDASFAQDEDQENDRRMLKALATKRAESAKASGGKRGGPRRLRPMAPILADLGSLSRLFWRGRRGPGGRRRAGRGPL